MVIKTWRAMEAVKEGREFHFTKKDFDRVCKLIYRSRRYFLSDSKQELVYSRLSRRLRATGISNFAQYLALLESNNEAKWEEFANSLTTKISPRFSRGSPLPGSGRTFAQPARQTPDFTVVFCRFYGEEPYTMAMTVLDTLGRDASQVSIVATDLDTKVLATARAGVYPEERISKLPEDVVKRFFQRGTGAQEGMVRVRQELRDMVYLSPVEFAGQQLVGSGATRCDLLPQCDDLFRQTHAAFHTQKIRTAIAQQRFAVCRAL